MDEKTKNKILKEALFTFGIDAQIDMAIEEMSELTKALCKYKRSAKKYKGLQTHPLGVFDNVREEIADVEIMLEQMRLVFDTVLDARVDGAQSFIDRIKSEKLLRLAGTVTENKKERALGGKKTVDAHPADRDAGDGSPRRYAVPFWEYAEIVRGEKKYIAAVENTAPEKGEKIVVKELTFDLKPTGEEITATVRNVIKGLSLLNDGYAVIEIDII